MILQTVLESGPLTIIGLAVPITGVAEPNQAAGYGAHEGHTIGITDGRQRQTHGGGGTGLRSGQLHHGGRLGCAGQVRRDRHQERGCRRNRRSGRQVGHGVWPAIHHRQERIQRFQRGNETAGPGQAPHFTHIEVHRGSFPRLHLAIAIPDHFCDRHIAHTESRDVDRDVEYRFPRRGHGTGISGHRFNQVLPVSAGPDIQVQVMPLVKLPGHRQEELMVEAPAEDVVGLSRDGKPFQPHLGQPPIPRFHHCRGDRLIR